MSRQQRETDSGGGLHQAIDLHRASLAARSDSGTGILQAVDLHWASLAKRHVTPF